MHMTVVSYPSYVWEMLLRSKMDPKEISTFLCPLSVLYDPLDAATNTIQCYKLLKAYSTNGSHVQFKIHMTVLQFLVFSTSTVYREFPYIGFLCNINRF